MGIGCFIVELKFGVLKKVGVIRKRVRVCFWIRWEVMDNKVEERVK